MKVIGLTGGIATGKTTVSKLLLDRGFKVIDADVIAREVVEVGKPAYVDIVEKFGKGVLRKNGSLDRKKLGHLVFTDLDSLDTLNAIVHPRVRDRVEELITSYRESGEAVMFFDCPLIFESHMEDTVDEIWVVYAEQGDQLTRMVERDGFGVSEAELRVMAQMPIDEKRDLADIVLNNTGSLEELVYTLEALLTEKGLM